MTLSKLVADSSWPDVKAALLWLYTDTRGSIDGYRDVFYTLRRMTPVSTLMRIGIRTKADEDDADDIYYDVIGRNGSLNRDQEDFGFDRHAADSDYALQETIFSICLTPWQEWLGMQIDEESLQNFSTSHIVAHCLGEMTFHGFTPADVGAVFADLKSQLEELKAMSEEERKTAFLPCETGFTESGNPDDTRRD